MPWDLRTKDGIVIRNIPDEVTPDDEGLKRRVLGVRDQQRMADPTSGMGFTDKFNAGMGKAFSDIGRGTKQLFGGGPSAEEVRETRRLDAPLMRTGAGIAGNIGGNVAVAAPAMFIPGVNSVAGAGAAGATIAALQPTEGTGERLTNMAVGGGLGAGTQYLAGPVAKKLGERAVTKQAELAAAQSRNSVRDETIRMGREAGYVVPPSAVHKPSFIGGRLESLAGKAALGQESALRNQPVTDALARRAAGLQEDVPITVAALRQARHGMAQPYRDVAALNPKAASDLEALQAARHASRTQWKHYNRSADPAALASAQSADKQSAAWQKSLEGHAQASGKTDLVQALIDSRANIAKNRTVQKALNRGTGSVDAAVIGRELDAGAPLTGELATIGRYQQSFPHFMREASSVPTPQVGKTELLASALLGGGGAMAGGPVGALAGLAPFASGPTRSLLLSEPVQSSLANPNYSVGPLTRGTAVLADPATRERLALLARSLALPAIPEVVNQ